MKKTIDDLRKDYFDVTGKKAAIRWNIKTLNKKITEAKILQAGQAELERSQTKVEPGDTNPEFEKLAAGVTEDSGPEISQPDEVTEPEMVGRGGERVGAGRPTGQTDRRAQIERVMKLAVPDLAVCVAVDLLNEGLVKSTGIGIDDKLSSSLNIEHLPHGSESMALGITKLLYFWFPSMQGRTDAVTLHLESLFLIFNPLRERAIRKLQIELEKKKHGTTTENDDKEENKEVTESTGKAGKTATDPVKRTPTKDKPTGKRNAGRRSNKVKRSVKR